MDKAVLWHWLFSLVKIKEPKFYPALNVPAGDGLQKVKTFSLSLAGDKRLMEQLFQGFTCQKKIA